MRNRVAVAAVLLAAFFTAGPTGEAQTLRPKVWSFDSDRPGRPPAGFSFARTGRGAPSRWVVRVAEGAPSGLHVLAQTDTDSMTDRFPLAVADGVSGSDLRLSVRCRLVSGRVDRACGLVLRYRDEKNYYVARANALEGNVRFYFVRDGRRRQLANWDGEVASGAWHEIAVEASGDRFRVFWDGRQVIETKDGTFRDPGRVGLWTKADSLTEFDDFSVRSLVP